MWDKLRWKKSVLVRFGILGLFVNTLTAEYNYSRRDIQNFPPQFQTLLSEKRKGFYGFSIAFLKCTSSLEHFQTKDEPSSSSTPEIIDSKQSGYLNVYKRPYFRTPLCKQRVSGFETLLKAAQHKIYRMFP